MFTLSLPVLRAYAYPKTGDTSGEPYPYMNHAGVPGDLHCLSCGQIYWHPDLDEVTLDEVCWDNFEMDCECKTTFASYFKHEDFNVYVVAKNTSHITKKLKVGAYNQASRDLHEEEEIYGTTLFREYIRINTDPNNYKGASTDNTGYFGGIRCTHCLKLFKPGYKTAESLEGTDIVVCECERTFIREEKGAPKRKVEKNKDALKAFFSPEDAELAKAEADLSGFFKN